MKKITLEMIKSDETFTEEELNDLIDSVKEVIAKYQKKREKGEKIDFSISPAEERGEETVLVGTITLWLMKKLSTPAAYRYMVQELKKALEETN